eukprot:6455831-Amphidinium_carterae.1
MEIRAPTLNTFTVEQERSNEYKCNRCIYCRRKAICREGTATWTHDGKHDILVVYMTNMGIAVMWRRSIEKQCFKTHSDVI